MLVMIVLTAWIAPIAAILGTVIVAVANNKYNSAQSQVRRLQKAGLSKNAIFSVQNLGNSNTTFPTLSGDDFKFRENRGTAQLSKTNAALAGIQLAKSGMELDWLKKDRIRNLTDPSGGRHVINTGQTNLEAGMDAELNVKENDSDISDVMRMISRSTSKEQIEAIKEAVRAVKEATDNTVERTKAFAALQDRIDGMNLGVLGELLLTLLGGRSETK